MANLLRQAAIKFKHMRLIDERYIYLRCERNQLRRLFELLDIDCVFDVGANTGQYGRMLRKHVGYRGPIVSFEPNPAVASILRENVRGDRNWFVEEVALGASVGQAMFNVMAEDQMSSLHRPQNVETDLFNEHTLIVRTVSVAVSTLKVELDKLHRKLRFKRPFLKMDCQGHDLDVAVGANTRLKEFVGLQSELAFERIYANTSRYDEVLKFYEDNGFILSALVENNEGHFPYLIETDCIMFRSAA